MSSLLKISITKEVIEKCKNCGSENMVVGKNCAIAIALADIFPDVYVTNYFIFPFGIEKAIKISLPEIAQQFVKLFDSFRLAPKLRLLLPEFEFTIDLNDEVINQINIDEVKELLDKDKSKYSIA